MDSKLFHHRLQEKPSPPRDEKFEQALAIRMAAAAVASEIWTRAGYNPAINDARGFVQLKDTNAGK
jgi:hypothetical protein